MRTTGRLRLEAIDRYSIRSSHWEVYVPESNQANVQKARAPMQDLVDALKELEPDFVIGRMQPAEQRRFALTTQEPCNPLRENPKD